MPSTRPISAATCLAHPGTSAPLLNLTTFPRCAHAGYRIVRLPASSSLRSCPFKHAFNNGSTACDTTDGRTLAIETDVTCEVRVFVLGDSKCSKSSNMPSMDG